MSDIVIKVDDVYKQYRLGTIGGRTLQEDIQSFFARKMHKEDPNLIIGKEDMSSRRGERFNALSNVSFEVHKGDTLGIIGHNGAGKSTLLKLLSRVTAPTKGTVSYNGRISSMLEVGTGFSPELTGRENVYLNGSILGMTKSEIDKKFDEIVEFAEMQQFIDTPVKRYSSGMYVKLAFAVSAHLDADILVMDEVLAVGDMKFQQKCLEKMGMVAATEGRTILYVSHNMSTIRQLCNRCIVLEKGQKIYDGDVNTAVGIYMNSNEATNQVFNDLRDSARQSNVKTHIAKLISLELLNKENAYLVENEKLSFCLKWENYEETDEMHIRFIIKTLDDVPIATYLSPNVYLCKKGTTSSYNISLDVSDIVAGTYKLQVDISKSDANVNFVLYDSVNPACSFSKEQSLGIPYNLSWISKRWGSINSGNITVEESK